MLRTLLALLLTLLLAVPAMAGAAQARQGFDAKPCSQAEILVAAQNEEGKKPTLDTAALCQDKQIARAEWSPPLRVEEDAALGSAPLRERMGVMLGVVLPPPR